MKRMRRILRRKTRARRCMRRRWLAVKLIPPEVLEEARREAAGKSQERGVGYIGAAIIILF